MRMTPPHLQPEGATLTHLTHKVAAYSGLNRKDKETLIEIIRESGMLCVVDDGRSTTLHHPKYGHNPVAPAMTPPQPTMECKMNKQLEVTPEALRKQADALIKAAEEAEKKAGDRAEIKKQLDPLKLEILQAYGMASRKFDEFVDAMAEVGKAVQKLKDLTV
ncbi:hypothetical protein [Klebsiella oxytoca]|uniref:hypothetical protein n=1 Tax=Klebsiella oxytoca TaxID=571 RepID=UPI002FF3FB92